ncbi:hypothetical protein KGQ20_05475 [Catenulispora sp. NF23]|uniref:Uncharacterized protein n=1 Tax=Catenulispora pinistramenti TaxID=2705254 RepID=A0ABS5KJB1_9ACTN|nr:hypothetical protein [Catenulispora pinistramenti]MBS2532216.1 hypothetical protein [Catenulispora pinistramenti]MBS2546383.1 hypothetical protein [Catenulispora pinistramenti]
MTVLTPNEKLTGTPGQKREILDRLTRFRTDPARTLKLGDRYPHLEFVTLPDLLSGLADRDVFTEGVRLARDRFVALGATDLLPFEQVFVAVASTMQAWGGFHHRLLPYRAPDDIQTPGYRYVQSSAVISRYGDLTGDILSAPGVTGLDLLRAYVHDCHHYLTFRSYWLGATGIHRHRHGINYRRESGQTYSARDPEGSASTRNLGVVMEGAFDREATAIASEAARAAGIACPAEGIDRHAFLDATGNAASPFEPGGPWLEAMSGYAKLVTAPYAAFLAEIGGPAADELHAHIIRATLTGDLTPLERWLDTRYGPGEFVALFRSGSYASAA